MDNQSRTVFLKTVVRFDPPEIVDGPRSQRWVHLRGSVLDQAVYAEPALTTRLVNGTALDPRRREAALVAGFAAAPPPPQALILEAEGSADTLALLRLRAGATFSDVTLPGTESEAGRWLRAYASEAERQGFRRPAVVPPQQISAHHGVPDADRRPLEAAFMAWNARRLAVLPETLLPRHPAAVVPPPKESKRIPLIADALRADRPDARTPVRPGAHPPETLLRFAPGTPEALEIDGVILARLGCSQIDVETTLRILGATLEGGVAVVTVAVVSATARIGDAVVARLGAAPAAALPAAGLESDPPGPFQALPPPSITPSGASPKGAPPRDRRRRGGLCRLDHRRLGIPRQAAERANVLRRIATRRRPDRTRCRPRLRGQHAASRPAGGQPHLRAVLRRCGHREGEPAARRARLRHHHSVGHRLEEAAGGRGDAGQLAQPAANGAARGGRRLRADRDRRL
ncbi:MAG: hypothetical protein SNJ73_09305 [Acetobacteraceae bacterium]